MRYIAARPGCVFMLAMFCWAGSPNGNAQHVHLTAGALSQTPGSQLSFLNADSFVASSGFVFNMVLRTNGTLNGLYEGGPTFTAAGSDGLDGPPAAPGTEIALVVKSLSGPVGSSWGFWESQACEDFGTALTFSLSSGTTNATNAFLVSQALAFPDPYGHCHGRRFTTTRAGLHTVGVQLVDLSRRGPGGAPLHSPSPVYQLHFQAGYTIARLALTNSGAAATFATRSGSRFYLEAKSDLDPAVPWSPVSGPFSGNNRLHTFVDPLGLAEPWRFYRLRVTTP